MIPEQIKLHFKKKQNIKEGFLSLPRKVMIQTHSRCNAACGFCPYPHLKKERYHGLMENHLFDKILSDLHPHAHHIDTIMPYLMNEPLLDASLTEKIHKIKHELPKASVHFLTNGTLLTEETGEKIIQSPVDWLGLSVFGISAETYESSMGVPYSHFEKQIVPFVRKAIRMRGPEFIMITFFKWGQLNDQLINDMHAFWRDLGVERISYFESGISRAGNAKGFTIPRHEKMKSCLSLWSEETLHILNDGQVIPCCMDWKRETVLGNFFHQNLEGIWLGEAYSDFRKLIRGKKPLCAVDICSRCEMAEQ